MLYVKVVGKLTKGEGMPLYNYKCPNCNKLIEVLVNTKYEKEQFCVCSVDLAEAKIAYKMERVLGTPSAPQWHCSTSHSRSKGF